MPSKEDAERKKNPVHIANSWRDHCRNEVATEAQWKAGYGKFLVGEKPRRRETKEEPLRLPARGRLSLTYDQDIQIDLANRHIQRTFRVPQLFSHHNYPKQPSYKVELPDRPLTHIVHDTHTTTIPKMETWTPPIPRTENQKYGWLVNGPVSDTFEGIAKAVRRRGDLAKRIGLPYEAW
ncbi:hypothetical protein RvY_18478 [Ramazzottius varieornatus]|uniref:Uncharacterized protein n=1 Tax=Ramazzottius varieornatus TaxID=947166 RepID=A0A1D1W5X5_RAMVA|nr:hypothetical protein RvY_18478 [Ramazzottius varieornatus]